MLSKTNFYQIVKSLTIIDRVRSLKPGPQTALQFENFDQIDKTHFSVESSEILTVKAS